ncbi:MAG TPA: ComF family protein [Planctomycetota bacterium]|nr:ComF family protein [Planctomycetota bacterium]
MATLDPAISSLLFDPGHAWRGASKLRRATFRACEALLDLFFPPHCAACEVPLDAGINKALCKKCSERIRWIGADRCVRCGDMVGAGMGPVGECVSCKGHPPRFVNAIASVARYEAEGPSGDLVKSLKFRAKNHLAKTMGKILSLRIQQTGLLADSNSVIVVPTPLTRGKLFERGYNQAEELARWVARELKLKLETRVLKKIRATRPQAMLSEKQRRENLNGAFACSPRVTKKYDATTALLVDDVITTGSTVSECARTLHGAGIKRVVAASFARG